MKKILLFLLLWFLVFPVCVSYGLTEQQLLGELSQLKTGGLLKPDPQRLADILEQGLHFYESLKNYRAIFYKTESSSGVLGPTEKIYLKYEKPWKIYMGWLNTHKEGLQVVYERGKHDNKLAIHQPGFMSGFLPVVFLDQNSPWVKEGSASYNIEDAGIGTFLFDFTKAVIKAAVENKLDLKFSVNTDGSQAADVTFVDSTKDSAYFAYRVVVSFDEKTRLPVRMELFDWEMKPMGVYVYEDLKVNVGPDDEEFKRQIHRQLYKVYYGLE